MSKLILAGAALACLAATPALAMSDAEFLSYAIKGDNTEATIGHLAGQKGATAQARSDGETIAGDHEKARIEAVKLSDLRGLKSPTGLSAEGSAELAKLKGLSGAAFDRELADFLVKDHEKTIAAYKSEAESGKGPVARYAEKSIPMLEKHLQMAEKLQQGAKVAGVK